MGKMRATFKGEDKVGGEIVGPVFVYDEDDPQNAEVLDWMSLSAARELARERGYELDEDI
jgi:hypothetical protein